MNNSLHHAFRVLALMKKCIALCAASLALVFGTATSQAASIFEYAFNTDGTVSNPGLGDPLPSGVDLSAFDLGTGLGAIEYSVTGAGSHYFAAYVDHEIDESVNTFFNELGSASGTPGTGQTWEIDEPGFVFGNIYQNFLAGTLDGTVGAAFADDVAMALGWSFTLDATQTATINLVLSDVAPASGFFLEHNDPESGESVFMSGVLTVQGQPPVGVPDGGATFGLLLAAMAALQGLRSIRVK
jgi:hypothetical protein